MSEKVVKFKEAIDFAENNGYIFAVYERQGGNYVLKNDAYWSRVWEKEDIEVTV